MLHFLMGVITYQIVKRVNRRWYKRAQEVLKLDQKSSGVPFTEMV